MGQKPMDKDPVGRGLQGSRVKEDLPGRRGLFANSTGSLRTHHLTRPVMEGKWRASTAVRAGTTKSLEVATPLPTLKKAAAAATQEVSTNLREKLARRAALG